MREHRSDTSSRDVERREHISWFSPLDGNSWCLFLIYKQGELGMINTIPDAVRVGLLCTWSSFHFLCWLHNCLFWVELMPLEEIKICRATDRSK